MPQGTVKFIRRHPRVSNLEMDILGYLLSYGSMCAVDIRKNSNWAIKEGSTYATLGRMEKKGLIESSPGIREATGHKTRLYSLTALGLEVVSSQLINDYHNQSQQELATLLTDIAWEHKFYVSFTVDAFGGIDNLLMSKRTAYGGLDALEQDLKRGIIAMTAMLDVIMARKEELNDRIQERRCTD